MTERELFVSHIKSLKAQLRVLKARLETPLEPPLGPGRSFAQWCAQQPEQAAPGQPAVTAETNQPPEDEQDLNRGPDGSSPIRSAGH